MRLIYLLLFMAPQGLLYRYLLYVSRGIGVVGVPIRVFAPPEIELFELRRAGG